MLLTAKLYLEISNYLRFPGSLATAVELLKLGDSPRIRLSL
jgi:hypothetical protein